MTDSHEECFSRKTCSHSKANQGVGLGRRESENLASIRLVGKGFTAILMDSHKRPNQASVAQLAEQLICNQQVVGSSPSASPYEYVAGVWIVGAFGLLE